MPVEPKKIAVIESVVVTAKARRKGIGKALITEAENWARKKKAAKVTLNVFSKNTSAQALYKNAGFKVISIKMERELSPRKKGWGRP